jgi:hypothetical protein
MSSLSEALETFRAILEEMPATLQALTDRDAGRQRGPGKWSRKEILGHLIDSASNNHQRFVRMQLYEGLDLPGYSQDEWVATQRYQKRPWQELIDLWLGYNRHLWHVMQHVPGDALGRTATVSGTWVTLEFLMTDYVVHLEHHVRQIAGPR